MHRRLVLREHQRISRERLTDTHFEALHRFDDEQASTKGRRIFIWRHDHARARQWVGVLQIPGLTVEILPKVGPPQNLLYMLHRAGELPFRARELADQAAREAPLIDILLTLFTDRLLFELGRGSQHAYLRRRDNQPFLKGKLLVAEQLRRNLGLHHRFAVEYDHFCADTPLNRVFKAACRRLITLARSRRNLERLHRCLILLDEVRDTTPTAQDFQGIHINRQTERFSDLFTFACMVLEDHAPTSCHGDTSTFSLLFDMNIIFERFVTALFTDEILRGPLGDIALHSQASGRLRHLAHNKPSRSSSGVLPLKADLLMERGSQRLIIDTKWKRLDPENSNRQGVLRQDLFQLFAYAHTYDAPHNILLYPRDDADLQEETYFLPPKNHRIRVAFLNLRADLWHHHETTTQALRTLLLTALPNPAPASSSPAYA